MFEKKAVNAYVFPSPEPPRERTRIVPVFLPFSGCPRRCVFCAQETQTGATAGRSIFPVLAETRESLHKQNVRTAPPAELAFYGGTFTLLPSADFQACLAFAREQKSAGHISGFRCSTRPDAVTPGILNRLKESGCRTVELGVQSFSDTALHLSGRGYSAETARRACSLVREAGLGLGIQLMPGMPGVDTATALEDCRTAAACAPDAVRLYPCLVVEGTELARWWKEKRYAPWDLDTAVEMLAEACLLFRAHSIPIIRMGVAEEPGLAEAVLAGPRHPGIGGMARALALYRYIAQHAHAYAAAVGKSGTAPLAGTTLSIPRRFQGELWGQKHALEPLYRQLGLERKQVRLHNNEEFTVCS